MHYADVIDPFIGRNMIKPIYLVTLLSINAFTAHAENIVEPGIFLGLDLSTSITGTADSEIELSNSDTKYVTEDDVDANSAAITLGYRFPSNNRFQISLVSIDAELKGGIKDEFSGTDFDWQFVYGLDTVQPYWGLGFGLYTFENTAQVTEKNKDLSGLSLQLLGGIKIDLHKHFEVDVSYRIKSISWQDIEESNALFSKTTSRSHTVGSLNFGAAVKF